MHPTLQITGEKSVHIAAISTSMIRMPLGAKRLQLVVPSHNYHQCVFIQQHHVIELLKATVSNIEFFKKTTEEEEKKHTEQTPSTIKVLTVLQEAFTLIPAGIK